MSEIRTTCAYCGVGCGILASKNESKWVIKGDPDHPANFGRLCSKGTNLGETLGHQGRMLHPQVDGETVSWDTALDTVASKFATIAEKHGPEAIAFYLSGQLLTEDYYVANKLAKGFIGTPNVDTNSRLCMASSVAGHKRAFGSDTVPACYEDLDIADLIILDGSNAAWCHPVLYQRIQQNRRKRGGKLVTIDVRETATTEGSDLALIIKPGTDAYLFNGLLSEIARRNIVDRQFVEEHCVGFSEALAAANESSGDIENVASKCGLAIDDLRQFYDLFIANDKTVSCYSLGIHMSSSGTDKVNAILNCHLATGRIGKEGSGPLSLTGQPNAMGGREVGGLANQLAAHMGYDAASIDKVARFWNAPNIARSDGLKAVEMFDAIAEGKIKAVWIQSTNPAVSMTDSSKVREALANCEFVVVSDCMEQTDTLDYAQVKLPAAAWGEKNGTVTNSERCISRQRAFITPPRDAKPDWWMVNQVAIRMGFEQGFNHASPAEIFAEHAGLSAFENDGERAFDLSGLCEINEADYEEFQPVQWPVLGPILGPILRQNGGEKRLFGKGGFTHKDRKARLIAVEPRLPVEKVSDQFPLQLISGRVRDQWHTMTRSGKSPTLSRHRTEPYVEISAEDAKKFGLVHMGLARVTSRLANSIYRVRITDGQPSGTAFVPIHWSRNNSSGGLSGALFASHYDPHSGQPEGKAMPVFVEPIAVEFSALIISRKPLDPKLPIFWTRARAKNCYLHYLAIEQQPPEGWPDRVATFLDENVDDLITYEDKSVEIFRAALFKNKMIETAVFIAPGHNPLEERETEKWFNSTDSSVRNRWMSISPASVDGKGAQGDLICSCFAIDAAEIVEAISSGKATSVEDIGKLLSAGTNCGSCLPEIAKTIESAQKPV